MTHRKLWVFVQGMNVVVLKVTDIENQKKNKSICMEIRTFGILGQ